MVDEDRQTKNGKHENHGNDKYKDALKKLTTWINLLHVSDQFVQYMIFGTQNYVILYIFYKKVNFTADIRWIF